MRPFEITAVVDVAELSDDEALALYTAVGWTAYTRDPERVRSALAGSTFVATARRSGVLVGLVRAVSDDASVSYVQDLLVHPDVQRLGVGSSLMRVVADRFAHVRQHVLLTDDEPGQRAFYESLGYAETRDLWEGTLRAFVRFAG